MNICRVIRKVNSTWEIRCIVPSKCLYLSTEQRVGLDSNLLIYFPHMGSSSISNSISNFIHLNGYSVGDYSVSQRKIVDVLLKNKQSKNVTLR